MSIPGVSHGAQLQKGPAAKSTFIPLFAADQPVRLHRDPGYEWRIGPGSTAADPTLRAVLTAAADPERHQDNAARAWALLLRADFGANGRQALHELVPFFDRWRWHDLEPLFFRLAVDHPELVASLFPDAVSSPAAGMCGEHGRAAALRELQSGRPWNRQVAAQVLRSLAEVDFDVSSEPLLAALRAEEDVDTQNTIKTALDAVDAMRERRGGKLAQDEGLRPVKRSRPSQRRRAKRKTTAQRRAAGGGS